MANFKGGEVSITVVVVTYNSQDKIPSCLSGLRAVGWPIVVVDNASTDTTARIVAEQEDEKLSLLRLEVNTGFGSAANCALWSIDSDWCLIVNPDVEVWPKAVLEFVSAALRWSEIVPLGAAGALLRDANSGWVLNGSEHWPNVLHFFSQLSGIGRRIHMLRRRDRYQREHTSFRRYAWVSGSLMLINRSAALKVGGFDDGYFLYFEDVDLCRRLRYAGYGTWRWGKMVGEHAEGTSSAVNYGAQRHPAYYASAVRFYSTYSWLPPKAVYAIAWGVLMTRAVLTRSSHIRSTLLMGLDTIRATVRP